jgi:hypothetical protein
MVPYGVRDFISQNLSHLSGTIRRVNNEMYGQHLVLTVSGTPAAFENLENGLLRQNDAYWHWRMTDSAEQYHMANFNFNIVQSSYGAACGPNSDPKYDNKSQSRSSKSSR